MVGKLWLIRVLDVDLELARTQRVGGQTATTGHHLP